MFQSGIHRAGGVSRVVFLASGAMILGLYGFTVNIPRWDFGKLLGIYVVIFFVLAQVLAKIRFNQAPTAPIYLGGALIVTGGLVIGFWRS